MPPSAPQPARRRSADAEAAAGSGGAGATGPEPSRQLYARASRGDVAALDGLLALHVPRLRAFVRLRCGATLRAKESSSDIVQSICRDVLEHAGNFEYSSEPEFRGWLYTAAARKIADRAEYWGAEKRDPARELGTPIDGAAGSSGDAEGALLDVYTGTCSPSAAVMGREALARIEAAFDALPAEYREAVVLSRICGLPRAEVARQMGRSEDSVRHLLFRGLAELASRLGPGARPTR